MTNFNLEPPPPPGRLRRLWNWLNDAHLELPEEALEVQSPKSKVQSPVVTIPEEPAWLKKYREFNEKIDRKKEVRIG